MSNEPKDSQEPTTPDLSGHALDDDAPGREKRLLAFHSFDGQLNRYLLRLPQDFDPELCIDKAVQALQRKRQDLPTRISKAVANLLVAARACGVDLEDYLVKDVTDKVLYG